MVETQNRSRKKRVKVSTNIQSMVAQRYAKNHTDELALEDSKLSSGDRIVRSTVDPAGLAISELMKAKIRSSSQAERNSNDSVSLIQVAEGSLSVISGMGVRLRELAMQAASDTVGEDDRQIIDLEFQQMKDEMQRITASTSFNGNNVIKDSSSVYDLQIGISGDKELGQIRYDMSKILDAHGNFGLSAVEIKSKVSAQSSLTKIDRMMNDVGRSRAELGSLSNRMNYIISNLQVSRENVSASNSKIRDADVALESALKAKAQVAQSATLSMLKMANDRPSVIMKLVS